MVEAIRTPEVIEIIASFKLSPKNLAKIAPVKAPVPGRGIATKTARENTIPKEYILNLLSLFLTKLS